MAYPLSYLKKYYQLKQQIEQYSERDRISILVIALSFLLALWFFAVFYPQKNAINAINQKIEGVKVQTESVRQKEVIINSMLSSPDTDKLIIHYGELAKKRTALESKFLSYSKRYINSRDLAKLLHDMLEQTFGVTIVDFSTVTPPPVPPVQPVTPQAPVDQTTAQSTPVALVYEPIHYRLVLRGTYFSIMNYLKRLESLEWRLYWDKFDYSVTNYPEGNVAIDFYTLKPPSAAKSVQQGVSQ